MLSKMKLLHDLATHVIFLQCDVAILPLEKWSLSLPCKDKDVTVVEEKVFGAM